MQGLGFSYTHLVGRAAGGGKQVVRVSAQVNKVKPCHEPKEKIREKKHTQTHTHAHTHSLSLTKLITWESRRGAVLEAINAQTNENKQTSKQPNKQTIP